MNILDELGRASGKAQSLRGPITSLVKLKSHPDQRVYIMREEQICKPPLKSQTSRDDLYMFSGAGMAGYKDLTQSQKFSIVDSRGRPLTSYHPKEKKLIAINQELFADRHRYQEGNSKQFSEFKKSNLTNKRKDVGMTRIKSKDLRRNSITTSDNLDSRYNLNENAQSDDAADIGIAVNASIIGQENIVAFDNQQASATTRLSSRAQRRDSQHIRNNERQPQTISNEKHLPALPKVASGTNLHQMDTLLTENSPSNIRTMHSLPSLNSNPIDLDKCSNATEIPEDIVASNRHSIQQTTIDKAIDIEQPKEEIEAVIEKFERQLPALVVEEDIHETIDEYLPSPTKIKQPLKNKISKKNLPQDTIEENVEENVCVEIDPITDPIDWTLHNVPINFSSSKTIPIKPILSFHEAERQNKVMKLIAETQNSKPTTNIGYQYKPIDNSKDLGRHNFLQPAGIPSGINYRNRMHQRKFDKRS
ncbi:hypothetical protein HDV02_002793 [Globomyces sp. JEL0801]|nr:hypothetical protein HDV02_002793 [Globomyces sp. JEL0801]